MNLSRVEPKVKASGTAAAVAGFVLWLLQRFVFHHAVPAPVDALIYVIVPAVFAFVSGYLARHQHRSAAAGPQHAAQP